ncbi:centrosomal protein kizuna isoform X1 [Arapaima gigas]
MPLFDSQYLEKTGVLQQSLYQSEKRRLDLERELFTYHTSDAHSARVNNAKLCSYLKNVCEREKQAKKRNLQLLKDVERMQACGGAPLLVRSTFLRKQEEYWNNVTRLLALRRNERRPNAEIVYKGNLVSGTSPVTSSIHYSKEQLEAKPVFMGLQTSSISTAEPLAFSTQLLQPLGPLPRQMLPPSEPLGHGVVSHSRFPRQEAEGRLGFSSFVLARSNSSTRQSKKKESAAPLVLTNPAPYQTVEALSSHVTLKASHEKEGPQSMPKHQEGHYENDHKKVSSVSEDTKEISRSIPQVFSPKNGSEKVENYTGESESCASSPTESPVNAADASSELPLSPTEDKDPALLPGCHTEDPSSPLVSPLRGMCNTQNTTAYVHTSTERVASHTTGRLQVRESSWTGSVQPQTSAEQLTLKGLFHLLNSIEGRLDQRENKLYKISSISEEKLDSLISLCNSDADLNGEDLEACGAVVLHQFQRLSWSMSKGCLLPREIVSAHWTAADRRRIRSCLPPDEAVLWDRWLEHVHLLESSNVLTASEIVDLFTPLLVQTDATYGEEAKVLVKKLLSQAPETSLSLESDRSSSDLPSLFDDSEEVSSVETDLLRATDNQKQELQSAEEDSKEEGFVESIPIRETKAYQLLKQSATQQRQLSSEEHDDASDLDLSGERHVNVAGKDVFSKTSPSSQEVHQFRTERTVPAVKSKAFWGESEDSGSDIEAALRPPSHHDDDFDFSD